MTNEQDIDMVGHDMLPEDAGVDLRGERPDPNSLGSILSQAIADVESAGGREAHLLRGVIGKGAFDQLPARKSTAQAWQVWRGAPAHAKPHRWLAVAIAKSAGRPDLVDRITREINDMDPFASDAATPPPKATPVKAQERKTYPRAAAKSSPRDGYLRMLQLATKADSTDYIKARAAER
jgi:hypothetical protein